MSLSRIRRVLVANRGEIAVRVIRTCHRLGIPAAVVYSEADRDSRAVRMADRAYCVGPAESLQSYLAIDRILEVAERCNADAVHPGYGFLAENATFARRVADAGLIFVGPHVGAIEAMGDKINSRRRMTAAGVPVVPGFEAASFTRAELADAAASIGYPVMLKATAGGGGKGIRIVQAEPELWEAYQRSVSEAEKAFGDGTVYLEKAVQGPHHVEVQVFGDKHGNVVHMFERECSIQRRHQKVLEETPSPFLTPALRASMTEAAVQAARAIGYDNAGTIEFLVDANREFYFLEMNTRLQVEHPITEEVLGLDLVAEQLRVAAGETLSVRQEDLVPSGHAIEVRICAEDPDNGYLPAVGRIRAMTLPAGPGVRVDSALFPGLEVSLHYDSMLAKLICRGATRAEAIAGLKQALTEMKIAGIKTNIPFLGGVIRDARFVEGRYDTGFLASYQKPEMQSDLHEAAVIAAALHAHTRAAQQRAAIEGGIGRADPWKMHARARGLRR